MTSTPTPRITRKAARSVALRDQEKVRQAALSVGLAVAVTASAVFLLGLLVILIVAITRSIQITTLSTPTWGGPYPRVPRSRFGWLSADEIIWIVAVLAVVMVVLTAVVGWMAAKRAVKPLADALQLQRHFVADASHELRTPLTALSSRVQILKRRVESGKEIDSVIAQLQTDADTMTHTLNDLLLTAEGATPSDSATSVEQAVNSAVSSLSPLAEQSKITLTVTSDSSPMVKAPSTSLTRAIVAVIDNAIQHSPDGTAVEISSTVESDVAVIRVRDHGPGISGVDPDHLFDRFAHGTETGGRRRSFGLGLALASEVAHRFDGELKVEFTGPDGTCFILSMPNVVMPPKTSHEK